MNRDDNIAAIAEREFISGTAVLLRRMERWAKYFSCLVIVISALVVIGWQFNVEFLKRPIPHLVAMNPVSAVAFIFSGFSLLFLTTKTRSSQKVLWGKILAGLILLIGLLQLVSIISGLNSPVDTILYSNKLIEDITGNISNGMAPNTAFCFLLTAIALLLLNFETRAKRMPAHGIAIIVCLVALLSIVGYLYRVEAYYGMLVYIPMSIHSATCFLFISLAILFANPAKGIMKELTGTFSGSVVARFLIPTAIILPILLGLIRLIASWKGNLPLELGVALLVISIIIIFLALTWFIVVSLNKRDMHKLVAEKASIESEKQIQTIFNAAPNAVIVINEEGRIIKWNPKSETLFGWKENEVTGKLLSETIIPERFRETHTRGLKHFLRTGDGPLLGKVIETCALTKNNTELDVALNIAATSKIEGRYLFIGFVRDMTEQRKAKEQIQKQKQDIQDFIDSMSTLSAKLATDGKILMVNKIALQASGLSMEELLRTNFTEGQWWTFNPEVHERVRDAFKKACSGAAINYDENIFVFGQVLTINFSLIPILKPDGGVDYVVAEGRDITPQKKAEEKIRQMNAELEKRVEEKTYEIIQSEKKFRNLIENSTDIISLSDEKFRPVYRSPSAVRVTGWINEEKEKAGGIELTHPDDLAKMKIVMKEILENPGKPFQVTFRTRHKEGHYIWMEGIMTNMLHDESIKAIVGNMRDITESKKAQGLLQASENRFRSIIEQFPYPVVTYTPDGNYTNANEAWEIMWQYKREDVKDYNIRKDPQMMASGLSIYVEKAFAGEVATSEPYLYDPVLIGHDSRKRWMQMTLYPLKNIEGEILEVILILLDVTADKEAEESLRKSVKEISDYKYALDESSIVAITDQKGIIKYVNNNFCKISKYSREELIGQDHRIINSGYHPKEFIRNLWVTIANGKIWKGELKNEAKDGTIYWVDTTIVPFLNDKGKPYQYVAIRADITDRKKAENEIQELNEELEQKVIARTAELNSVNKEMEAFTYSVSHDLRAPLRGIIGFTAILEEDYGSKLDNEAKRVTSVIKSNTLKMGRLIDDLLDFSRTARKDIAKGPVDMSVIVKEVVEELTHEEDKAGIVWNIHSLPVVQADVNTMRQVWVNLISNAIKYSGKKKHPQIEIGIDKKDGETVFFVKDNGIGFDIQYRDKLFKVFQRLHSAEEFEGTGVGLALVEKIVSRHGGKVWAEGKVNIGATFYFSLPAE